MLAVYTFVFSVVFKARWGAGGSDSKTEFALVLFAGFWNNRPVRRTHGGLTRLGLAHDVAH